MEETLHIDKTFEKVTFTGQRVHKREFDNCVFRNCDLSACDFSYTKFIDCVFETCNLSNVVLENTRLADCQFTDCKLLGIHFVACEDFLFKVSFKNCMLDYSSFMFKKMAKTNFSGSSLRGVGFGGCNLSSSIFDGCELDGAVFRESVIDGADLSTARNYIIHPEINSIKGAKFSVYGLPGLLAGYGLEIVD